MPFTDPVQPGVRDLQLPSLAEQDPLETLTAATESSAALAYARDTAFNDARVQQVLRVILAIGRSHLANT